MFVDERAVVARLLYHDRCERLHVLTISNYGYGAAKIEGLAARMG